jgi:hypothetical protein
VFEFICLLSCLIAAFRNTNMGFPKFDQTQWNL